MLRKRWNASLWVRKPRPAPMSMRDYIDRHMKAAYGEPMVAKVTDGNALLSTLNRRQRTVEEQTVCDALDHIPFGQTKSAWSDR